MNLADSLGRKARDRWVPGSEFRLGANGDSRTDVAGWAIIALSMAEPGTDFLRGIA